MAGYSGTPLAKKLGIKPNGRVLLIAPPAGFTEALEGLPDTASVSTRAAREHDVIILFAKDAKTLQKTFAGALRRLNQTGGLWVAWPKKSSGVRTDLTENMIRDVALAAGLVDNKVCAIDGIWAGLRLVVRLKDRKDPPGKRPRKPANPGAERPRRGHRRSIPAHNPRRHI